jgi:hypothetical protein
MHECSSNELDDIRSIMKHGVKNDEVFCTISLFLKANNSHRMAYAGQMRVDELASKG